MEFPRQGSSGGWNSYARPQINTTTADLHLMWDVPYEPGTIKAVGRKGGKVVLEEEIRTTGDPAAIRLSVDKKLLDVNTRDVAHVKVEVVDENGLVVPDANNLVQITVEGAGKLIGLDNGNPVDHTSMKSRERKAFNGLALAVVQISGNTGGIRVKATSPGLKDASVELTANSIGASNIYIK